MGAARHDDESFALHVDYHVLVVPDHRIGFPSLRRTDIVDREALLKLGHALDLTGDEDGVVQQQRLASLLDEL